MLKRRFIGDIHGKFDAYQSVLSIEPGYDVSVQVGDFGIGFAPIPDMAVRDRFIRGNHDNPGLARQHPNWIEDGTFEDGILYIGGAKSLDYADRFDNVDRWPDEELNYDQLGAIIDLAVKLRPRVIVSHDGPQQATTAFFGQRDPDNPRFWSVTSRALTALFDEYQPDYWIFGHWHRDRRHVISSTRFTCLGINSFIDIEV